MKIMSSIFLMMLLAGCSFAPRMTVVESTLIGLSATPGDASSKPPQVTLAYKRLELAVVPTDQKPAQTNRDCYSSLTALSFKSRFFGPTQINDFISTGYAARNLASSQDFGSNVWQIAKSTNVEPAIANK